MKSRLRKLAWKESYDEGRAAAIVYINGKVYEAPNHSTAIVKYYDEVENPEDYEEIVVGYRGTDGNIYLSLDNLRISRSKLNEVYSVIKEQYPGVNIYQDNFYNSNDLDNGKRLAKTAGNVNMLFDSIALRSGDLISFSAKIVSNRPWFQIEHESQFNASSYYDGPDFERAMEMYTELTMAFKGVRKAEEVRKSRAVYERRIETLKNELIRNRNEQMYQTLKRKPLFLGIDDF